MVVAGLVQVKGQELLNDRWYVFSNIKTAIFTFTGAKLKIDGVADIQYVAVHSSASKIFNYFDKLYKSNENSTILVLGKGRSSFCTTISNYFVRMHKKIIFTEIDPSKGNIFPGTLSTMFIDEGFKLNNPHCLFYGNTEIDNIELYDLQIDALVKHIQKMNLTTDDIQNVDSNRFNEDDPINIKENHTENIDFNGNNYQPRNIAHTNSFDNNYSPKYVQLILAPEMSIDNLNNIIKKFNVKESIFVGDERMFNKINLIVKKIFIENYGYIYENTIPKSINRYFNGINNEFTPCSFIVKQNFWNIVRIGEEYVAPDSALPLGATRKVGKTAVNKVDLIENSILAISDAKDENEVATSPVSGFITCVDEKKFRILCTQPRLPKQAYLIQGNIRYIDF